MHQINNKEPENIYAKNDKSETVFILDCERGARGYYCLGCNNEMEAVHRHIVGYRAYFRHHYKGTPPEKKCTYSDETYRHALAKFIFQETKQIKVPQLLKYHPTDKNGLAIKLRDAEILEAFRVEVELPFFENEEGEVCWSKQASFRNDHLLIKPDITFFDAQDKPIVFIEIVATHKIDDAKKAKIRRLGINTVQIVIPKGSPEAIADCLKSSQNVKWIYHDEEAKSDYLHLSELNPETVSYPDADQRKLLGETFTCRAAEINNLIRSIEQCLRSEQYLGIRENLESELARVKGFTEQQEDDFRKNEEEYRERYSIEIERERENLVRLIADRRSDIDQHCNEQTELEKRYFTKRGNISGLRQNAFKQFTNRVTEGDPEVSLRIKEIIFEWESARIIAVQRTLSERIRQSLHTIANGSYKDILEGYGR